MRRALVFPALVMAPRRVFVCVAVEVIVAPCARTKQGSMGDAARAQGAFVFPESLKNIPRVYLFICTTKRLKNKTFRAA
jgi:hypothetical protein